MEFGSPEESITLAKNERLRAAGYHHQQTHNNLPPLWRIDVEAMERGQKGEIVHIELIKNISGGE